MSNINKNYIVIALVTILFLGTIISYFALDQPDSEEITLPNDRNDLIALAQEFETLNVFVDAEIYNESFFNFVRDTFSEKYGINLIITSGHWSGVQTQLINEKVSGQNTGSYDLLIYCILKLEILLIILIIRTFFNHKFQVLIMMGLL